MFAEVTALKARMTRARSWPERSMATIVLSNVGSAACFAIESISVRWRAIPASIAGW